MGEAPGQTPAISQVPPGSSHFSGALHETLCLPPGKPAVSQLPASLLEALLLGPVCCPEGLSPFRAQANPAPGGSGPVLRQPPGWPQPLLPLQYGKRENSRLDSEKWSWPPPVKEGKWEVGLLIGPFQASGLGQAASPCGTRANLQSRRGSVPASWFRCVLIMQAVSADEVGLPMRPRLFTRPVNVPLFKIKSVKKLFFKKKNRQITLV